MNRRSTAADSRTTTLLRAALVAALSAAGAAVASSAGNLDGTWECRQPGVQYNNKPPILYVSDTGGSTASSIDVDGFAREVYGRADVAADADGWWKVSPATGPTFLVRPEAPVKPGTASMALRLAGGSADYNCLRLPPTAAVGAPPPTLIQGVVPADAPAPGGAMPAPQGAGIPEMQGLPPAQTPGDGAAPRAN